MSDVPEFFPLDCVNIAENYQDFPISSKQPTYFVANSFKDARVKFEKYNESLNRPFNVFYDPSSHSIEVDRRIRAVETAEGGLSF
jgi:phenylalanine-4-hydroxylase